MDSQAVDVLLQSSNAECVSLCDVILTNVLFFWKFGKCVDPGLLVCKCRIYGYHCQLALDFVCVDKFNVYV